MAYTIISSHSGAQNWPNDWGASGTLGIFCTRDFVADDGKSFQQGDGTSLTQQFVTTATITVVANIPTYGSYALPKTDVATPIDARYMGYIFDSNGVQRDLMFGPFDLVSSLGDSITYLAWVNDNAQTRRYPIDTVPTTTQMNLAIAAAIPAHVPKDYGVSTLVALAGPNGEAAVTVSSAYSATSALIMAVSQDDGITGSVRAPRQGRVAGVSFPIYSNNGGDAGVVAWWIF